MDRRTFLGGVAPAVFRGAPSGTIGVAAIGVGTRGSYLMRQAQAVPGVEVRVICDLYEGNRIRAKSLCTNPRVRFENVWEKAVEAPEVDAVIIATPDFWHAPITIRAAQAKKDIYVEKGWCIRLSEAKQMRRAIKENKVVMQLGHHYNSLASFHKAREIYRSGQLGTLPLARIYYDYGVDYPTWKFYAGDARRTTMPEDATS